MKKYTPLLIFGLLSQTISCSAEPNQMLIKDVPISFQKVELGQVHKYKWVTTAQNGDKRGTNDYAVLVISNRLENGSLLLHDVITLSPPYGETIFERTTEYSKNNLLQPKRITLDIAGDGKTVREMSYENGEMKILN